MGHKGPAFLAYDNFDIYLEWNQSLVYTLTAANFAARLTGAPPHRKGNADQGLGAEAMTSLQRKLARQGYDVGKVDGILGLKTRQAVRAQQKSAWVCRKMVGPQKTVKRFISQSAIAFRVV